MKTAISILLILVLSQCVHAGLWETGFRLDGPIGESPTPAPAAADSSVGTSDYKVAGWALILGGGVLAVIGWNHTRQDCTQWEGSWGSSGTDCTEESDPNWPLIMAGTAIALAGSVLIHTKGK
jgi:hypothetical protein